MVRCPICHKKILTSEHAGRGKSPAFPFCSERCKLIDLGAWLDADYAIDSGADADEQDFDGHDAETVM